MKKSYFLAILVSFAISASGIMFAQVKNAPNGAPPGSQIPNLIGTSWVWEVSQVELRDPWDSTEQAKFTETIFDPDVYPSEITEQEGGRFAGYVTGIYGQRNRFIGVVAEDGTVTVQMVIVDGQTFPGRSIAFGRVIQTGNKPIEIRGTGFEYQIEAQDGTDAPTRFGSAFYFRMTEIE